MPRNVVTGKAYRGGSSVWLASVADRRVYSDERWATHEQVQSLDGQFRRGEKGSAIRFSTRRASPCTTPCGWTGRGPIRTQYSMQTSATGCRGASGGRERTPGTRSRRRRKSRRSPGRRSRTPARTGPTTTCARDRIIVPFKEQFPTGPAYYQTALHEVGHWTGHPDRLNAGDPDAGHRGGGSRLCTTPARSCGRRSAR